MYAKQTGRMGVCLDLSLFALYCHNENSEVAGYFYVNSLMWQSVKVLGCMIQMDSNLHLATKMRRYYRTNP